MRKVISLLAIVILSISSVSVSSAPVPDRVYRGLIRNLGYDLAENRVRVDVSIQRPGDTEGRGQVYFENEAAKQLDQMIHEAFLHDIRVEVWVHPTDSRGRQNVIFTVNFSK
jgi:arabinogalactan endo-1,4-beta-galactosidase